MPNRIFKPGKIFLPAIISLLLAACGGSGGGGGDDDAAESNLELAIRFPTVATDMNALTDSIVVSGSLVDTVDNVVSVADVASLTVNGVAATLDPGDPTRWTVTVPIEAGTNNLRARVVSASGSVHQVDQPLLNLQPFVGPNSIALNGDGSTAYVLDDDAQAIFSVDMATGVRDVVSSGGVFAVGSGETFGSNATSIAFDGANNRVVYSSRGLLGGSYAVVTAGRFRAADLDTGDRIAFGSSPAPVVANATIVDPASGFVYGVHRIDGFGSERLLSINPATSAQTTLQNALTFGKDHLELSVDAVNDRLITISVDHNDPASFEPDLTAIDLATGVQSAGIDSCSGSPDDVRFRDPTGLDVDAAGGVAYVTDLTGKNFSGPMGFERFPVLMAVDLATGDCSLVSGHTTGAGEALDSPQDVALDLPNNRALVVDAGIPGMIAIDLASGDRTLLSNSRPAFDSASLLAADLENDRLFVSNAATILRSDIYEVDLQTRLVRLVSSDAQGAGNPLEQNIDFTVDSAGNRLLVADGGTVVAVDIDSGDRNLISGERFSLPADSRGTGPAMGGTRAVEFDTLAGDIYVVSNFPDQLFRIDPASGDREVVSDVATGTGPVDLTDPKDMALDAANGFAYVVSGSPATIVEVDLATGNRRIVSDNSSVGSGELFVDFGDTQSIVADAANQRLLVNGRLYVDIASGDRELLFQPGGVNGVNKSSNFQRSAIDSVRDLVYLTATADGVLLYDRESHTQGLIDR